MLPLSIHDAWAYMYPPPHTYVHHYTSYIEDASCSLSLFMMLRYLNPKP